MISLKAFDESGALLWTSNVNEMSKTSPIVPVLPVAPAPVFYPTWSGRTIVLGNTGADVQAWQDRLMHLGFTVPTSGTFDVATVAETKTFQSAQGLDPTGLVDEPTWKAAFHPFAGV